MIRQRSLAPFAVGTVLAASFAFDPLLAIDCAKAATPAERTVCGSAELLRLDRELNAAFQSARDRTPQGERDALRTAQRRWLEERDQRCGGAAACLAEALRARVAALRATPGDAAAAASPRSADAVRVEMVRRRESKDGRIVYEVSYPQLVGLTNREAAQRLNRAIEHEATTPSCDPGMIGDWSWEGEVTQLDARFLALRVAVSGYCTGAAYPNEFFAGMVFDLTTGRSIDLPAILRRDEASRNRLAELLARHLPSGLDEECREPWEEFVAAPGDRFSFWIDHDGLVIEPRFIHALAACSDEITLSTSELRPLLVPGGPLD